MLLEIQEHLRIEKIRKHIDVAHIAAQFVFQKLSSFLKIGLRKLGSGAALDRLDAGRIEDDLLQHLGPAAFGKSDRALHHLHDAFGKMKFLGRIQDIHGGQAIGDHEQSHIADDFAGRRDLDDIAEQLIHRGVRIGDLVPAVFQAKALGLLAKIGVLAAGHLVLIDLARCRLSDSPRRDNIDPARPPSSRPTD